MKIELRHSNLCQESLNVDYGIKLLFKVDDNAVKATTKSVNHVYFLLEM